MLRSVDDMVERFITFLTQAGVMDETCVHTPSCCAVRVGIPPTHTLRYSLVSAPGRYLIFSSDHGYHVRFSSFPNRLDRQSSSNATENCRAVAPES